jgi:hypothetical protein
MYQSTGHAVGSYQAQGALFIQPEDFSAQIAALNEIAVGIETSRPEPQITIATANKFVKAAIEAGTPLTDKAIEMSKKLTNVFVTDQIVLAANSVFDGLQSDILPLIFNVIRPAKAAGLALVPSAPFQRALAKQVRAITRGWETLAFLEDIKPFILRNMPATLGLIAKIGSLWVAVAEVISEPFVAAVEAADNLAKAAKSGVDIVMWTTIGGGLFLLYWYGLRKK